LDKFFLRVFAKNSFKLTSIIPKIDDHKLISKSGKWDEKSAGGSIEHSTWINNPQYVLETTKKMKITVSLEQEENIVPNLGLYFFKNGFNIY
jgi:hypothetical protein